MATCVDVAGASYPTEFAGERIQPMEGRSLKPLLVAASPNPSVSPSPRSLCWEHEGNRAIREGNWKLVALAGAPWELYDLAVDRVELNDLAAAQPGRVQAMAARWDAWAKRTHVLPRPDNAAKKKK
jgi:arylsulfatase